MSDWTPEANAESLGCFLFVLFVLCTFLGGTAFGYWGLHR